MVGEKVEKKKISPSLIVAVIIIIILLAALVYYATLPPKVEVVPTTIVQTALRTETLPGTTIVRTEVKTTVQTVTPTPTITVPKKLKLWRTTYFSDAERERWEWLYDEYRRRTGMDIEVTIYSTSDLPIKLTTLFEGRLIDALPDVIWMGPLFSIDWATKGYLEPLDEIAENIKNKWKDDLIPLAWELSKWPGPDGKKHYYGLATAFVIHLPIWRVDILKDAGFNIKDASSNFEKFEEILYKIKSYIESKGLDMVPMIQQVSPVAWYDSVNDFELLYYALNGVYMLDSDGTVHLTVDGIAKTIDTIIKWYKDGIIPSGVFTMSEADNNALIIAKKAVMTPNGFSSIYQVWVSKYPAEKENLAGIGYPALSKYGLPPTALVETRPMGMPAGLPLERRKLAEQFINFFFEKDVYEKWFGHEGGFGLTDVPILKPLAESPPFTTDPAWIQCKETVFTGMPGPLLIRPSFSYNWYKGLIPLECQKVIMGVKTSKEAAETIIATLKSDAEKLDKGFPPF